MRFILSVEAEEDIIAIAEQGVRIFGSDEAGSFGSALIACQHATPA